MTKGAVQKVGGALAPGAPAWYLPWGGALAPGAPTWYLPWGGSLAPGAPPGTFRIYYFCCCVVLHVPLPPCASFFLTMELFIIA